MAGVFRPRVDLFMHFLTFLIYFSSSNDITNPKLKYQAAKKLNWLHLLSVIIVKYLYFRGDTISTIGTEHPKYRNIYFLARNEKEKVLIESSFNSIRVSIMIKQADELEEILGL